jgi:hypothetical protein
MSCTPAAMNKPATPGYSGTPLVKKLGFKQGSRVWLADAPADYAGLLAPLPADVLFLPRCDATVDVAHVFVTERDSLAGQLAILRNTLKTDAVLWISWPKKSSKVPTTVTEDVIRELALPIGFVDVKVCAVTEVWSGLKLVVRKELR